MKRFKVTGLLSAILLVAAIGPSQAITYGSEINNASSSYPSVVSIWTNNTGYNYKSFLCTGNLISPTVVLTAAHCVLPKSDGYLYVGYGADRLDNVTTYSDVSATWKHPRYSHNLLVNDVGLLLLPSPLPQYLVSPLPSAAAITSSIKAAKGNYEIAGWGVDQNGEQATYLKHTFVADQTSIASKTKGWNNAVWLAVGKYNKTERIYSGACNGDSGGPLYSLVGSSKTLIGLTSWGAADCELGKPSVYTRLSYYLNDIRTGLIQLNSNEKTDNRLPAPTLLTKTSISGPTNSIELKSSNTYTCIPATAGPNDRISVRWSWGGQSSGKTISENRSIVVSINDLKANIPPYTSFPSAKLVCDTYATGPGGLVTSDYASIEISLTTPPQASITVTKNYDTGFSYSNPSTCKVDGDYPGQVMKWLVSSQAGWGAFGAETYPSDTIVVGTGPIFRYTMQNIALFSGKWLYCAVERNNAIGASIGADFSSYTWPDTPG